MRFLAALGIVSLCLSPQLRAQVELHLWHQMRPEGKEILRERIRGYEASHPGVRIYELYKENEELRAGFQAAAAFTGGGPELVYGPSDFVGSFRAMDILQPLEGIFDSTFLRAFDPKSLTWYKGHLYQIGDEVGNHLALVWNRRLFAEEGLTRAPRTFSELIEYGKRLTKDKNGDGVIDQYGLVWNFIEPFFFIPFYSSFGGWVMDSAGRPTLNNRAAVEAFRFVTDLRDRYRIMPVECDYEIADSKFNDGRAAMIINGAWAWGRYLASPKVDFGLAVLPRNDRTGLWPAPMVAAKGYYFNRYVTGERLREAVAFVKFMTSRESQILFAKALKTIPSRLDAQNDSAIRADPVIAVSIEQARLGRAMPLVPEMRAIWDAMRPAYQSLLGGNIRPERAAAYQQELAERKIRELNEGSRTDPDAPAGGEGANIALYGVGILLACVALYSLMRNFLLPLLRLPKGMQSLDARFALLLIFPAALIMFGVVIYPFAYNFVISLANMNMTTVNTWRIIGLSQYGKVFGIDAFASALAAAGGTLPRALRAMLAGDFYLVLLKTLIWTLVNVTLHVLIGVSLALLLNRRLPGKSFIRVLLVLPWAVPSYITALTWRGLFNTDSGAINIILKQLFHIAPIPWLNHDILAFAAAIITNVWLGFPFMMVIALGGLQSIPRELYEAADIDGASAWQRLRAITIPLLKPVMIPAVTLGIVWTFNNLNVIWLVSNGGEPADTTHILVSYVYRAAFNLYRYSYAAAFSFIIFLILAAFSLAFMRRSSATRSVY